MCSCHAAEVFFSAAKILPNPKLKKKNLKEKFLCRIFGINCGT